MPKSIYLEITQVIYEGQSIIKGIDLWSLLEDRKSLIDGLENIARHFEKVDSRS